MEKNFAFLEKKCVEACITIPNKDKYGDQKYFDEIEKIQKVNNSPYIGLNLAQEYM